VDLSARCAEGARLAASSKSSFLLELAAGKTAEQTFEFIIPIEGSSRIFFRVETTEAPDGYATSDERFLTVVSRDGKTEFFDSLIPSTGKARTIHPHQGPLMERASSKTTMHHTVSFTGKFTFVYEQGGSEYGVYGAGCRFWFHNRRTGDWWHPIPGNLCHTHYDYLGEDGSFSFNFEFDADLTGYDEIWIRVSCANEATVMPAPDDGYNEYHEGGYTPYLGDGDAIHIVSFDTNSPTIVYDMEKTIRKDYSSVLRNMTLSREFVKELYGGSLPFALPSVASKVATPPDGYAGVFIYCGDLFDGESPRIEIDPRYATPTTIDHEYGHFCHYCIWGQSCSSDWENDDPTARQMHEGWAIFYQFAARSFSQARYGDEYDWNGQDRTESPPFYNNPHRYTGIAYSGTHPDYCALGCYFWSIYDGYDDDGFEAAPYLDGDNDDVSGHKLKVFEALRTMERYPINFQPDLFHLTFKEGLPPDEQQSVDDVMSFMFEDLYHVPTNVSMRSPQAADFNGELQSSGKVVFHWSDQEYMYGYEYGNLPAGYRIYKQDNGWQLITQLPSDAREYVHEEGNVAGLYRVSAFNSLAGESALPQELDLSVTAVPAPSTQLRRITSVYPNPFNPRTTVSFTLDQPGDVLLQVVTLDGRRVKTLLSEHRDAGDTSVQWDGRDDSGNRVSSGQYFVLMTAGDVYDARKMILIR